MEDAAHELEKPRAPSIDDTGLAELVEHLGGPFDGVLAAGDDPGESLGDRERTHLRQLGLLGHLADHRQHRPLHGNLDRLVRARGARPHRVRQDRPVHPFVLAEYASHASDDRREDHARVPLGLHRRRPLDIHGQLCGCRGGRALELGDDSLHRHLEVRPGVAVGHGVDVERVDPTPVPLDAPERGAGQPPGGLEVDHRWSPGPATGGSGPPGAVDMDVDAADRQARVALDLVRDAGTDHRGHLRQVDPVVDDDVELQREPAFGLAHTDARVVPPRERSRSGPLRPAWSTTPNDSSTARPATAAIAPAVIVTRPWSVSRRTTIPFFTARV